MLERDIEKKFMQKKLDEKDRNEKRGEILNELINEIRQKNQGMNEKDKEQEVFYWKKRVEAYQIELERYKTVVEMELAMNGLNNTSKFDLIEETSNFINQKIDELKDSEKEKILEKLLKRKNKKEKISEKELNKAKNKIKTLMKQAVFKERIKMPEKLVEKLEEVIDTVGLELADQISIKKYIRENVEKRVVSTESQMNLLKQLEEDLEAVEKDIDPFQQQLLHQAKNLDIEEADVQEKKIEVLRAMTEELETRFNNLDRLERQKSQEKILEQIAKIRNELSKHDVKEALETQFQSIDKDAEEKFNSNKNDSQILMRGEEQKENLLKEKRAEFSDLKRKLKEFRYLVKPKIEISEPKHPYDYLQKVEYSVAVKPAGKKFKNMSEEFFEQFVNYNENAQHFARPDEKLSDLFEEKIQSLGQEGRNCVVLKKLVKKAIYNGSKDYTSEVLRARLGAQALSSVLNGKRFTADLGYAVLASLLGAGTIGYVLDTFAWPALLLVFKLIHPHSPLYIIVSCILNSLTALFGETFDSAVIKKFLDTIKGGEFLPASLKEAFTLLKDSGKAGTIAAIGSLPYNFLVAYHAHFLMPAKAIANQISTSAAGAMIPMEINEMNRFTKVAFLLKTQSGFYAKPSADQLQAIRFKLENKHRKHVLATPLKLFFGYVKEVTDKDVYQEFVRSRVNLAVTLGKTSSFATSSMGIGSFLGFITWLPVFGLANIGFVNEAWQRIISITTNTPTEIYSFSLGTLTANMIRNKSFTKW